MVEPLFMFTQSRGGGNQGERNSTPGSNLPQLDPVPVKDRQL